MAVVNTNISALVGLNNLRLTGLGLQTSLERLSSGLRINKEADDPSGLALAKGMEAQIGGIRAATENAEDANSLIETADGALAETHDILMRMRDLSVRAANSAVWTSSQLQMMADEFDSLQSEIDRKSTAVTFNTKVLFDGTFDAALTVQVGPDNGAQFEIGISINAMQATVLGLGATGSQLLTAAAANISIVNSAIDRVSNARAALGITERRLDHIIDDLAAEDINISAAKSRIMDADLAQEISEFTRLQILQQSGTAILAQANAQPQSVLQLLR